jgi:hypothetical protein
MATDWNAIQQDAIQEVESLLENVWPTAAHGAIGATSSLIAAGKYVEENLDNMTVDEGKFLMAQQKIAMQNVLLGYQAIGVAIALNAVNSVITVIISAVPALAELV